MRMGRLLLHKHFNALFITMTDQTKVHISAILSEMLYIFVSFLHLYRNI